MPEFTIAGENPGLEPSDVLETGDGFSRYDIVTLERKGAHVFFRVVRPKDYSTFDGKMYQVDMGDSEDVILLRQVRMSFAPVDEAQADDVTDTPDAPKFLGDQVVVRSVLANLLEAISRNEGDPAKVHALFDSVALIFAGGDPGYRAAALNTPENMAAHLKKAFPKHIDLKGNPQNIVRNGVVDAMTDLFTALRNPEDPSQAFKASIEMWGRIFTGQPAESPQLGETSV